MSYPPVRSYFGLLPRISQLLTQTVRLHTVSTDLPGSKNNAVPTAKNGISKEKTREEPPVVEETGEYVNPVTGERGGPRGLEPTRYGDWERKGRVSDF